MLRLVLTFLVIIGFTGCVPASIVLVGAGAVGGYSISRDTFEGNTSKSQEELWDAATKVLSIMGSMDYNDRKRGEITGRINGSRVWVTIIPVNMSTTKLRIKARRGIFPSIGTAQEYYSKVLNQLE